MASHRMPDEERPRRAVPAWVTAPPEAPAGVLEAHPTLEASAPVPGSAGPGTPYPVPGSAPGPGASFPAPASAPGAPFSAPVSAPGASFPASAPAPGTSFPAPASASGTSFPAPASAPGRVEDDVVVPDYPPEQELLPPAPTSPAVHTVPFDRRPVTAADAESPLLGPAPVSPIDAVAFGVPNTPVVPVVPVVGQPRFSVPGLEHVVVAGAEPEPSGPIGYRTPARFAHQQRPLVAPAPLTERSFDAVLAPQTSPAPAVPSGAPGPSGLAAEDAVPSTGSGTGTGSGTTGPEHLPGGPTTGTATAGSAKTPWWRPSRRTRTEASDTVAMPTATATEAGVTASPEADPSLQARSAHRSRTAPASVPDEAEDGDSGRSLVGVTPGALLGAVAGVMTLGVAAWWFTAPATVHGVGLVLGVLAVLLSVTVLRNPLVTWQRPVALLGAVLGGVGALVLLWAVASALLSTAGVALPDLTGTGVVPTLAP